MMTATSTCIKLTLFTLFTLVFLSPAADTFADWGHMLDRHAEHIGDVRLTSFHNTEVAARTRRSAEEDLPTHLTFTFSTGNDDVKMTLERNYYVDASPPTYVVRSGKVVRQQNCEKETSLAFYQDKETGAAVMVHTTPTGHVEITGSYFHDGEEFSIQPIRGSSENDVDHRISKLFQEADLQHDIIDFGSDILYGAIFDDSSETNSSQEETDLSTTRNSSTNSRSSDSTSGESSAGEHEPGAYTDSSIRFSSPSTTTETITISALLKNEKRLQQNQETVGENQKKQHPGETGSGSDDVIDGSADDLSSKKRQKREAKSYVVELLLVIDYGVFEVWRDGVSDLEGEAKKAEAIKRIKQFYSFVLNGVDLRYKSVQKLAEFSIDVTWAGIIVFDEENPDYWKDTEKPPQKSRDFMESSDALEAFCAWAQSQGAELPASDHVMLFTGHNLTYGGSVSNAGLAYLGSACNPDYHFSIVEEYFEFRDVAIAAHELGHSLGARHDMDGNTCLSFSRYIMTSRFKFPSARKAKNPWLFSQCSVDYFAEFIDGLDRNDTNCFITKDSATDQKEIQPFLVSLPGEMYAGDDLCRIGNGAESYICRDKHIDNYNKICYAGVDCYIPAEKTCLPQLPPDGFSCGNRKWCLNGTCTASDVAPATQGDDCPFGDDPGLIGGKTCAQRMLTSRYDCYREDFRAKCCSSCKRYRRNLPGCEYGDLFELCKSEQCTNYEEDYARENCCDTCAELLFTIPSTIATTPTPTEATTPASAPATPASGGDGDVSSNAAGKGKESVTSRGGNGSGGGSGGKGGIFPPSAEDGENLEGEAGERGEGRDGDEDGGDDGDGTRRVEDSEDSEDSDKSSRSDLGRRRYNTGRTNPYWRNERMVQIHSLLVGMRNSRDYTRLQRMRMLIYILDKTRNDDLADLILGFDGAGEEEVGQRYRNREWEDQGSEEHWTGRQTDEKEEEVVEENRKRESNDRREARQRVRGSMAFSAERMKTSETEKTQSNGENASGESNDSSNEGDDK